MEEKVEEKKGGSNKLLKIALVIAVIIIVIAIAVGGYFYYNYKEEQKTVGTTWGDAYYTYLKAASEETEEIRESEYYMPADASDTTLQFIQIEDDEDPAMVMTYTVEDNEYVRISKINDVNDLDSMTTVVYANSTIEYLYNISLEEYAWYIHTEEETQDLYKTVSSTMEEVINSSEDEENVISNETTETEETAENTEDEAQAITSEYAIGKDDATTVETVDGETLSISTFDQTFIKPEIEESTKIEFDICNMVSKLIKEAVANVVAGYKTNEELVTEEVEATVEEEVEAVNDKLEEIQEAEEAVAKKKAEEEEAAAIAKGFTIGSCTLKYGTYKTDASMMSSSNYGTITLNYGGTCHIKSNVDVYIEGTAKWKAIDCDGTYKAGRAEEYGEYIDVLDITTSSGDEISFYVGNNYFGDQWHGYYYEGE